MKSSDQHFNQDFDQNKYIGSSGIFCDDGHLVIFSGPDYGSDFERE